MRIRVLRVLLIVAASVVIGASPAAAHGLGFTGAEDVQLAQTVAGTELTVVIRRVGDVPGPLHIDVIAYRPVRSLSLGIAVRSTGGETAAAAAVDLVEGRPGAYPAVLDVHRTGAHTLELRAAGEVSRLPFRVLVPRVPVWEWFAYGGLTAAGLLLVGALISGAARRPMVATGLGGGGAVALVVALTVAALSAHLPAGRPDGAGSAALAGASQPQGRPYVRARTATEPAVPVAGAEFLVRVELYDGSTGRPVDDLIAHHNALAHAVVTSVDGGYFRHVHPRRTGAGRLEVRLYAERPGPHLVSVEFERVDSGGQMVSGRFDVAGTAVAPPHRLASPAGLTVGSGPVRSGRPTTIEYDAGPGRLQPWLGMAGHLIVRDASGDFLGHAHEMASMSARPAGQRAPDDTVAAYGSRLRFAFSFPQPGRYFIWLQYAREFRIVTVPFVLDVRDERG